MSHFWAIWTHAIGKIAIFLTSAFLTWFFFFTILPGSIWWLSVLFLVMFEYGVIHWYDFHANGAENPHQAILSLIMIAISLLAVATSNTFELMNFLGPYYGIKFPWMSYVAWVIVGVFPLNVLATILENLMADSYHRLWSVQFNRGEVSNKNWTPVKEIESPERKSLEGDTEEIAVSNFSTAADPGESKKKIIRSSRAKADRGGVPTA